ncbi:MAG: CvpA family protein [Acidobacteriaceae bacterium]
MTVMDWVIVAVLLVSTLAALTRGIFREFFSLCGLIFGVLLASWNYKRLAHPLMQWVHYPGVAETIAFLAIAIGVMLLAGLIGYLLYKTARVVGLGWADSLLGGLFGFLRGCLIVTAGMMAIAAFLPHSTWAKDSKLAPYFLDSAHGMSAVVPAELRERILSGAQEIRKQAPMWMKPQS